MKTTVNKYDFERAFADADRKENFSYEALGLLFDYFEQYEEDTGEEIELDVIAICCEYSEDTVKGIAEAYGLELPEDETEDEHRQIVFDYLSDHTSVVGDTADGFVYAAF
jgi:hypothetical protein